jgi:hypothetical protein
LILGVHTELRIGENREKPRLLGFSRGWKPDREEKQG